MYPSLTYAGNGSQWYLKEKTAKQELLEIALLEERLEEKNYHAIQVNTTILVRGKPVNQQQQEEEEEDEKEDEEESNGHYEEEVMVRDGHSTAASPSEQPDDDMMIDPFQ